MLFLIEILAKELYNGYGSCSEGTGNAIYIKNGDDGISTADLQNYRDSGLPVYFITPIESSSASKNKFSNSVGVAVLGTTGVLIGDDITGVGIADDVAIPPVVIIGGIAYIVTRGIEEVIDIAQENVKRQQQPTIIYRWGSGSNTNLTPRPQDATGLSFSTVKPASGSFVVTTMEQVNTTGVFVAIKDGPTHVSVVPIDVTKMPEWIESRPTAETNPHPLTQTLKSVVSKP